MAVWLSATLEGQVELDRILATTDLNLSNFKVPLTRAKEQLFKTTDSNFSLAGKLMGGWQPRKKIYRHPILDKTGTMRHNFRAKTTTTRLEIWNTTPYFKYHQSNKSRKRLPRRVMLKIIQADKTRISKYFQQYMADSLKGRSGK